MSKEYCNNKKLSSKGKMISLGKFEFRKCSDSSESTYATVYEKEKKKNEVKFKGDFVEVIEVECWKEYNIDVSDNLNYWNEVQQLKTETIKKEKISCNCLIY